METKKGIEISTDDFWYDLFEGGYIKPKNILVSNEYIQMVEDAILVLKKFKLSLESQDVINYL